MTEQLKNQTRYEASKNKRAGDVIILTVAVLVVGYWIMGVV